MVINSLSVFALSDDHHVVFTHLRAGLQVRLGEDRQLPAAAPRDPDPHEADVAHQQNAPQDQVEVPQKFLKDKGSVEEMEGMKCAAGELIYGKSKTWDKPPAGKPWPFKLEEWQTPPFDKDTAIGMQNL